MYSTKGPDFELFTSFRYDPVLETALFNTQVTGHASPYLLLPYHADRLVKAANEFGWTKAVAVLQEPGAAEKLRILCDNAVERYQKLDGMDCFRLRVLLSYEGQLRCEIHIAPSLSQDPLSALLFEPCISPSPSSRILAVYIDTKPTQPSEFTSYKTTSRAHYDAARVRVGIRDRAEPKEVLLWNEQREIIEGSFRNVAFWRDGAWVTPKSDSGSLPGTVRRWMLENGKVREGTILKDEVKVGEWTLLSNAVDVTILGRVEERPEESWL